MVRRRSNVLLGLAVALLVAAVTGVQLGQSAISEINPIHFQGAVVPPRGIDPNTVPPPASDFARAYNWNQGFAARAADCGDECAGTAIRELRVFSEPVPVMRSGGPYWRDATPTAEPQAWEPGEVGARGLSVERYMHYPVEREEEAAVEPPEVKAPPEDRAEAEPGDDQ